MTTEDPTSETGAPESRPRPGPLRRAAGVLSLMALATAPLSMFIIPGAIVGTDADVGGQVVFVTLEGREVALITYADHSLPRLGALFGPGGDVLAAIDTATGEALWEGSLPPITPTLIATGERYAYLTATFGEPIIVDVSDGSVVADGEGVEGIGADHPRRDSGFRYAADRDAVVLERASGDLRMIPIGELAAVPADQDTIDTWGCLVGSGDHAHSGLSGTTTDASAPHPGGGSLALGAPPGSPAGLPTQQLLLTDEDGTRPLGGAVIHARPTQPPGFLRVEVQNVPLPRACPDSRWADDLYADERPGTWVSPGAQAGLLLVSAPAGTNAEEEELIVLDAATGAELARESTGFGIEDVHTAPSGRVLVSARISTRAPGQFLPAQTTDVIYLIDTDGSTTRVLPGENGWFGL